MQAALTIIGIHRFLSLLSANKLVEPNVLAFTETLLGNTDGSLGWVGAPRQCSLGAAACCLLFTLTAAILMTSSRSEGCPNMVQ